MWWDPGSSAMAFTFAAFCYMLSLVLCAALIFFAIWHVSNLQRLLTLLYPKVLPPPTPTSFPHFTGLLDIAGVGGPRGQAEVLSGQTLSISPVPGQETQFLAS